MLRIGTVQKCLQGQAVVFVAKDKACGGCSSCAGCSAKGINITVGNPVDAKIGDIVEIKESEKSNAHLSALVFIAPVLLPVIIYSMLKDISEILAFTGVALSLILWGTAVFFINRALKKDFSRTGQIVKVISKETNFR